jgi:hypothetical protein
MNTIRSEQKSDMKRGTVRQQFHRFLERWEKYRGYPTLIMALLSVTVYFAVRTFRDVDKPAQLRFTEISTERTEDSGAIGVPRSNEILSGRAYDSALRLREGGALLMAVSLTAFDEYRMRGTFPGTANGILMGLQQRSLLPPGIEINQGVLRSSLSEITLNYRADPFSFEILSFPIAGLPGQALLFRFPIPAGEANSISYFQSSVGSPVNSPVPFSSADQLVASGWNIARWRGDALPLDDSVLRDLREQDAWLKSVNPDK